MLKSRKYNPSEGSVRHLCTSCALNSAKAQKERSKKGIFLPETAFKVHIKTVERSGLDAEIASVGGFNSFYQWQLNDSSREGLPLYVVKLNRLNEIVGWTIWESKFKLNLSLFFYFLPNSQVIIEAHSLFTA